MHQLAERRASESDGDEGAVAELHDALEASRALLARAQEQLEAVQHLLQEERRRNEMLSAALESYRSFRRADDPYGWGLEPGVGL